MAPYSSTRGQANLLVGMAIAQLVAVTISFTADEVRECPLAYELTVDSGYVAMLLLCAGVGLFVDWVRRATDNLRALGTTRPSFGGVHAVLFLLMPLANIPLSHGVLTALWHESQPRRDGTAPQHWLGAPLVTAWLLSLCAAIECVMVVAGSYEREALLLSWLATGGLFVAMVLATQRRQDEQWRDLELRRAVPRPSANAWR
jgi:hypothetical protein